MASVVRAERLAWPLRPTKTRRYPNGVVRRVRVGMLLTRHLGPPPTAKGTRMVNTYRTADEADRDKAHLVELFEALNASPSVLRRDDGSAKPRASV